MSEAKTTIDAGDGRGFAAYVSRPGKPNGHAVIVLQEIFGVTDAIRGVADRYAAEGYLALAPDLYWRIEPGVELSHSKADIERAFQLTEGNTDVALAKRQASIKTLEWERIHEMLVATDFNISEAARRLGMHRRTLARKLDKKQVR